MNRQGQLVAGRSDRDGRCPDAVVRVRPPELAATIAALALARSKSPPAASVLKNCWKKPAGETTMRSLA